MMRNLIARSIGRLTCFVARGHLRGKLRAMSPTHRIFECPRCGRTTKYRNKGELQSR